MDLLLEELQTSHLSAYVLDEIMHETLSLGMAFLFIFFVFLSSGVIGEERHLNYLVVSIQTHLLFCFLTNFLPAFGQML